MLVPAAPLLRTHELSLTYPSGTTALAGLSIEVPRGSVGLVGANGGIMSKYSVGIYSTTPVNWRTDRSAQLKTEIDALPKVAVTKQPDGAATVETYSVRYDWPIRTGIIVGRLDADGTRFMATTDDDDLVALMSDGDPLGASITVWPTDNGNRAALP